MVDEMKESDALINDQEKAHSMAIAEDPYQAMIANAKKNGLEDLVQELQAQSNQAATAAETKFDKATPIVAKELQKISTWIEKDKRGEDQPWYRYTANRNGALTTEVIDQIYTALGVDKTQAVQKRQVRKDEMLGMDASNTKLFGTGLGYYISEEQYDTKDPRFDSGPPRIVILTLLRPAK